MTDLSGMLDQGSEFKQLSNSIQKKIGCQPNIMYWNEEKRIAVLVVRVSNGGDFAVGFVGVQHLLDALKRGKIVEGHVVYVDNRNRYVTSMTAAEAMEHSKSCTHMPGSNGRGAYFWFVFDDPDVPF